MHLLTCIPYHHPVCARCLVDINIVVHRIFFFFVDSIASITNKHALYQCRVLSVNAEVIILNTLAAV